LHGSEGLGEVRLSEAIPGGEEYRRLPLDGGTGECVPIEPLVDTISAYARRHIADFAAVITQGPIARAGTLPTLQDGARGAGRPGCRNPGHRGMGVRMCKRSTEQRKRQTGGNPWLRMKENIGDDSSAGPCRALCSAPLMALGPAALWADEPVKGGTLVMARDADIFTFDPYNTQDDPSIFTELTVYDRLVKLGADGKSVEPELATGWTISADGLSADFTLRDGVKFSDGSPLSTEDVVFSLTRAIDQPEAPGASCSHLSSR
jgi:hypothetical protein